MSRSFSVGDSTVHVFDGLLSDSQVEQFSRVVASLPYSERESFDRELNCPIAAEHFRKAPFLYPITERLLAALAPGSAELSHVYAAAISPDDQTAIHRDVPCMRCSTFLYYANAVWEARFGGETLFYTGDGDAIGCCLPAPGRLVWFPAGLLHRAGVPQRDTPTFRYTVSIFYACPEHLQGFRASGASERT